MRRPLIALAAAATMLASPALAGSLVIQHSDLDLSTAAGQKKLKLRIDQTAREFCGMDETMSGTRMTSPKARACYAEAKAEGKKAFAALVEKKNLGG